MAKLWDMRSELPIFFYQNFVRVGDYLVVGQDRALFLINLENGEVERKPVDMPRNATGPHALRNEDGTLSFVVTTLLLPSQLLTDEITEDSLKRMRDEANNTPQTMYRVSVPDLEILESRVINVLAVSRSETYGDLLVTDALYRTACFSADGTKLWEHFQMHRTPVVDGVIYFSDNRNGKARMGELDVLTGEKRIFLSEPVNDGRSE